MADAETKIVIGAEVSGAESGLRQIGDSVRGFVDQLSGVQKVVAEAFAFNEISEAINKIKEAAEAIFEFLAKAGEAAEMAQNVGAAIGISAEQFIQWSQAMELAGGNADTFARAIRILDRSTRDALENMTGPKADAFHTLLGDDWQKVLKQNQEGDPTEMVKKLADAYQRFGTSAKEAFEEGFGRTWKDILPFLKEGSAGIARLIAETEALGRPTKKTNEDLVTMWEGVKRLRLAFNNFGDDLAVLVAGPLGRFSTWLAHVIGSVANLIQQLHVLNSEGRPGNEDSSGQGIYATPPPGVGEAAIPPKPGDVQKQVAQWLSDHGYTAQASAAIQGNIQQESSFNPGEWTGKHFGLAQWEPSRRESLGNPPTTDVNAQMELLDAELTKMVPSFKSSTAAVDLLTKGFQDVFEGAHGQDTDKRIKYAQQAYGGGAAPEGEGKEKAPQYHTAEDIKDLEDQIKLLDAKEQVARDGARIAIENARHDNAQKLLEEQTLANELASLEKTKADLKLEIAKKSGKDVQTAEQEHEAAILKIDADVAKAHNVIIDQKMKDDLASSQQKLKLDEDAEKSELKTAESQAKISHDTAAQLEKDQEDILNRHLAIQESILDSEAKTAAGVQEEQKKIAAERIALEQRTAEQISAIKEKQEEADAKTAEDIDQKIATDLVDVVTAALSGKKDSVGKAIASILQSAIKSSLADTLKSGFESSGLGDIVGGAGLGSLFGSKGGGGLFGGIGSGIGGLFGGGGNQDFSGGTNGAGEEVGGAVANFGIGQIFKSLFAPIGTLLGFAKGGIVPSAAGGWALPSFSGGIMAQLHSNEMVLPSGISQGLQGMIANGGGGHTINMSVQALDGPSAHKAIMSMGPSIVASINKATRLGSSLKTA